MEMAMRLDKFLSHMGYGTRNEVKHIIKNGWVTIEGKTIKKADFQVQEDQIVYVDDVPVSYVQYEYYILNKPAGYVSATEDNLHPTVMIYQSKRKYFLSMLHLSDNGQAKPAVYEIQKEDSRYFIVSAFKRLYISYDAVKDSISLSYYGEYLRN